MNEVFRKLIIWSIPISLGVATSLPSVAGSIILPAEVQIPGGGNDTEPLGTAYDSDQKGFFNLKSVIGDAVDNEYGNVAAEFSVGVDLRFAELYDLVSGSLGGAINYPTISADVGTSYSKAFASDKYNSTYNFHASIKPKKSMLIAPDGGYQITPAALELVRAFPSDKRREVGNYFVNGIGYGSFLIVSMKIEFESSEAKRELGGRIKVEWGAGVSGVKVEGKLDDLDKETKKSVKISISAMQQGGDTERLNEVIPDSLVECSLDDYKICFDLFSDAVRYMKTEYIYQFEDQDGDEQLNRFNVLNLYASEYKESGPFLQELIPEEQTQDMSYMTKLTIRSMEDGWVESLLHERRAENILRYYPGSLSQDEKAEIDDIQRAAAINANNYSAAVKYCLNNLLGSACINRAEETISALNTYDESKLNIN